MVEGAGRSRATIGLSGGIDSALSLAIAARALGPENVTAITLPSRHTEQVHIDDARACAEAAGLPAGNFLTASIEPILEGIAAVRPSVHDQPLRFGNASARARMIAIYDLAQDIAGSSSAPRTAASITSATSPGSASRLRHGADLGSLQDRGERPPR